VKKNALKSRKKKEAAPPNSQTKSKRNKFLACSVGRIIQGKKKNSIREVLTIDEDESEIIESQHLYVQFPKNNLFTTTLEYTAEQRAKEREKALAYYVRLFFRKIPKRCEIHSVLAEDDDSTTCHSNKDRLQRVDIVAMCLPLTYFVDGRQRTSQDASMAALKLRAKRRKRTRTPRSLQ
jgi:hypothetical protein